MQISGLVLHMSEDATSAAEALAALQARNGLELGAAQDPRRVPAVLTAPDSSASKEATRALEALAGIYRVEVVFVAFEDDEPTDRAQKEARCSSIGVLS